MLCPNIAVDRLMAPASWIFMNRGIKIPYLKNIEFRLIILRFYQPGVLDKQFVILVFLTLPFIDIITDIFQAGKA